MKSSQSSLLTTASGGGGHGGSVRASQPAAMGSNLDTPEIFWLEISDAVVRFRFFVTPDQPDFETNFASAVEFTSVSINQVDKEEKEVRDRWPRFLAGGKSILRMRRLRW